MARSFASANCTAPRQFSCFSASHTSPDHVLTNAPAQAMRYPLNAHRKELAAAEGAREREKELAKEIQEGGDLDDDGADLGDGF